MFNIIKLNEKDNIGIAPMNIPENAKLSNGIKSINNVPYGHKLSLQEIKKGDFIIRYGQIIGVSSNNIKEGEHVHSHNLTFYESERNYTNKFEEEIVDKNKEQKYFKGYKRNNGSSGTRNYIGLISTVNCSATVVKKNCR